MREISSIRDVQQVLFEWARWTAIGGINIDYPHTTPFYRLSRAGGWASKMPMIDDTYAMLVDQAVARLRLRAKGVPSDLRYKVLTRAYLGHQTDQAIARKLRVDRRTVSAARQAAESWVESHIIVDDNLL